MAELSHLESGVRLSIVGDGALRDDLEKQSASLGLQDVVRFEGEQNDVRPFLRRAHVFVLSSLWEGLPYTVIEAMASHLPVVSTDVGGCPELVRQAETGLLVPARHPSALASAMRVLWRDDALRLSMGNAGYDRARRHFRLDSCVAQNAEAYDELLGKYRMSHQERRRGSLMGRRATAAVLVAIALLAGAVVVSEASFANRIPNGVVVGGSEVGGQTIAQASRTVSDLASRPITVSVSATSTGMPMSGADLNLDLMSALDQAYLVGRVGALPQRVEQRFAAYRGQVTVPLEAANRGVVADLLTGMRQQLERAPVDAGFEIVGTELKVTPESPGVRVAEVPFLIRLGQAATSPRAADRVATVPVESLPASLTTAQLTRLAPQARQWTSRDIVGSTPSATYTLTRSALASLLTVRDGRLALSEARTAAALDGLSIPSNPPRDARMVVVDQTVKILDGAPGTQIDASATAKSIQSAMEAGQGGFSIVTKDHEPNVTRADLERLGINHQLSTYTTHFVLGQDGRDTNINLAASALRGKILGIGEDFSLNQVTGPRNRSTGYKESLIFSNGKVVPGVGGGVCQVSTTTYQAALRANMRILDRQAHSMAVSYVAPGLDATAFYPIVDLKFQNSSSGPVLLWSEVKGNALTVSIYGSGVVPDVRIETVLKKTMPQATRTVVDPSLAPGTKVVQSEGVPGYIVDSFRVIYQDGRVVKRELLASDEYRPRDRIVLVGN
jgi:vancomycin resistance protein YoaR